ncbi:MAG: hypothetical protein WDM79_14955 [Terricaulis sp.]
MHDYDYTWGKLARVIGLTIVRVLVLSVVSALAWPDIGLARAQRLEPQVGRLPRVAAQFIAVGIEHDVWRDTPGRHVEIAQMTRWRRETRQVQDWRNTHYYDSETGASVTWFLTHDAAREVLTANVDRGSSGYSSVSYSQTTRSQRVLGEQCNV